MSSTATDLDLICFVSLPINRLDDRGRSSVAHRRQIADRKAGPVTVTVATIQEASPCIPTYGGSDWDCNGTLWRGLLAICFCLNYHKYFQQELLRLVVLRRRVLPWWYVHSMSG